MSSPFRQRPEFLSVFLSLLLVTLVLFLRWPGTNFIFDEQEALLASPYLAGQSAWLDALRVDFWGLPPERTIGSYRPLPNLLWWPLAPTLAWGTPIAFQVWNLVLHALTGACLALFAYRLTRAPVAGACAGALFTLLAINTEAVCAIVGIADVLVGLATVSALLLARLKAALALPALFVVALLGLFSKETMLASLPVIALSPFFFPEAGRRKLAALFRSLLFALCLAGALLAYVALRRHFFHVDPAHLPEALSLPGLGGVLEPFLEWFRQPRLPLDPMNNPFIGAGRSDRIAGAFAIFFSSAVQVVLPFGLAGDHSFPRETVDGWDLRAGAGVVLFALLLTLLLRSWTRRARSPGLTGVGVLIWLGTYLPISGAIVLLPTVRAERLVYAPNLGAVLVIVGLVAGVAPRSVARLGRGLILRKAPTLPEPTLPKQLPFAESGAAARRWVRGLALFLAVQLIAARGHAVHYSSDLMFWRATSRALTPSAKSLLNHGIMLGARGDVAGRLRLSREAVSAAPHWPMGQIYLGDALCRQDQVEEAWTHYREGLRLEPNSRALSALALQCLWEKEHFARHAAELREIALAHPGGWLDYLVDQLGRSGDEHGGIEPRFRGRGYNQRYRGQGNRAQGN